MKHRSLVEVQRLVQSNIFSGRSSPHLSEIVAEKPPASQQTRIRIYQEAYRIRTTESLREDFEEIEKSIGSEAFEAIVSHFVRSRPSRFRNLAEYSSTFPDYLKTASPIFFEKATKTWMEILVQLLEPETTALTQDQILAGSSFKIRMSKTVLIESLDEFHILAFAKGGESITMTLTTEENALLSFLATPRNLDQVAEYASLNVLSPDEVTSRIFNWIRDGVIVCIGENL